ncbi:sarcospan isoform X1 [Acipenser oxyrinchus oxyrinchus]|uniref:Sarcospan isoform X1 n=1 Tax=Acipenser oxyrinchus oxyrinchus TaxID=40147 RepID=A0AAD8DCD3_ACIOX|nr:sarcospan isoform X1 [Acipenser oxyrinchus oxyrinchus]
MGKDGKSNPSPVLNNQSQEGKPGGEKSTDPAQENKGDMEKNKGQKGKLKAGQQEDSHICCGCRFPLLIALLQLILGISIAVVAFLMTSISSYLLTRETPHWAGIFVCLVSLLGFYLYCITYLPDERTSMQFIAKLVYFLLCAIGLIICVLAVAFAGHHYSQINNFTCEPKGEMESCVCKLDPMDPIARTFEYRDVKDCSTITTTLKLYFLLQIALNLTLAIVCLIGCFVMWKHRYQVFFVGLQLNSANEQKQQKV